MTKDTLLWLAGLLTRIPINTGADDWRIAARQIAMAQDEIATALAEEHDLTWVPPGASADLVHPSSPVAESQPVTSGR